VNVGELGMIRAIVGLLEGVRRVAVGARSPLPAAAVLLARELRGGDMWVSLLGSRRHGPLPDGGRELFDLAAQGRIELFFLSGCQIDGAGNVNLLGRFEGGRLVQRFAGNFGAPFMALAVPRLILFTHRHDRSTLVPRVDFISAPGRGPEGCWRRGGPVALVTPRALFTYCREQGRFLLARLITARTAEEVAEHTGFAFATAPDLRPLSPPAKDELRLLAGPVADALCEVAPRFAQRLKALAGTRELVPDAGDR